MHWWDLLRFMKQDWGAPRKWGSEMLLDANLKWFCTLSVLVSQVRVSQSVQKILLRLLVWPSAAATEKVLPSWWIVFVWIPSLYSLHQDSHDCPFTSLYTKSHSQSVFMKCHSQFSNEMAMSNTICCSQCTLPSYILILELQICRPLSRCTKAIQTLAVRIFNNSMVREQLLSMLARCI